MSFKKAERTKLWARVAVYGPSGSGKSYTALRIGRGLARRCDTRMAAIDTENRSLSKYAGEFDFDVDDLGDKTIDSYITSMNECIKAGYKVLVIDSLSHGWKELLEEVDRIAERSYGGNNWRAWAKGTPKQNKLVSAILNFPGHLIVTMRSKTEWTVSKDGDGKITISREGLSPEQGKGIEYEFDILIDINQKHIAEVQKDRTGKFQDKIIEKPGEEFGEALYEWLNNGDAPPPPPPTTLYQDCIDGMTELKNIMISTADDGTRLFTDDEYNAMKITLNNLTGKSGEDKLAVINQLLESQKKQLHDRFENLLSITHPNPAAPKPAATQPPQAAVKPETTTSTAAPAPKNGGKTDKSSLREEYRKMLAEKHGGNALATKALEESHSQGEDSEEDNFVDDIPFGDDEPVRELTATGSGGELDIF